MSSIKPNIILFVQIHNTVIWAHMILVTLYRQYYTTYSECVVKNEAARSEVAVALHYAFCFIVNDGCSAKRSVLAHLLGNSEYWRTHVSLAEFNLSTENQLSHEVSGFIVPIFLFNLFRCTLALLAAASVLFASLWIQISNASLSNQMSLSNSLSLIRIHFFVCI